MSDFDAEEYESFELDGATRVAAADDLDDDADDVDDELEDAADDEIDFVLAAYREDGQLNVQTLNKDLANDLDELIVQLRRLPADAGALGFVSLVEEVFVLVRVRGPHVKVLLSDGGAAADWPIARDVADYLNLEILDDDDDDEEPIGDLDMLADSGLSEFDMTTVLGDLDLSSDQMALEIAEKLKLNPHFRTAMDSVFPS